MDQRAELLKIATNGFEGGRGERSRHVFGRGDVSVVEVRENANLVRIEVALASEVHESFLEFEQAWPEASGEEQRRERVALVNTACGAEAVAGPSGVPEQVLGRSLGEHARRRREL